MAAQPSLAPGLPEDLEAVLGKLNAYCQCMHGAAGAVAGWAPAAGAPASDTCMGQPPPCCRLSQTNKAAHQGRELLLVEALEMRTRHLCLLCSLGVSRRAKGCVPPTQVPGVWEQHGLHVQSPARPLPADL